MKLKFVSDEEVESVTKVGRKAAYDWNSFMEELYKHPNKWAEFPHPIAHTAQIYALPKRFKDIEVKATGGNHLNVGDPDKKLWTLFVRYVPVDETF